MYFKIFFISVMFVFFSGCASSSSSENIKADKTKSWITSPPPDNVSYFYGVGYGETQRDAKSDALATISAKISVEVASKFSSSLTAIVHDGEEEILNETKNEVISRSKEIEYDDVKVKDSFNDGKRWAALVEVNRDTLTKTYQRKLNEVDKKLKSEWELYQNADFFEKLKFSVGIKRYLKETDNLFPLLHALNSRYDDSKYTSRYLTYTKQMRKAESNMVFKIKSDNNSKPLASLIRSELSAKNASFSDTNYNALINITTKAKKRKYNSTNEKFANLTFALRETTIRVTNRDKKVVSNVVYKTKSGSSKGYEDALKRVTKYEKKIKKSGIIAFITGN
jgi:hypothetical protein